MPTTPTGCSSGVAPRYSLVPPVLNEARVLPTLLARVDAVLDQRDGASEVIFIDDRSTDATCSLLRSPATADKRYARPWTLGVEQRLSWLPLGAQYAAFARA